MPEPDRPIRDVSDTAAWVAWYRAVESARPDALFRDPLAERLAGERGRQIAALATRRADDSWAFVTRTVLFDELVAEEVGAGADLVVNLAAGLDTRPYRMDLPAGLRWVEVDLPDILDAKERLLAGETPRCSLERVRLDLADVGARRDLFGRLGESSARAVVICEGLLVYLEPQQVGLLARDLAAVASFPRWVVDVASPGLLARLRAIVGDELQQARAPLRFGPAEGVDFFVPFGWKPLVVRSMLKSAAKLRRLPLLLRILALLPEPKGPPGERLWSAVCLLGRS